MPRNGEEKSQTQPEIIAHNAQEYLNPGHHHNNNEENHESMARLSPDNKGNSQFLAESHFAFGSFVPQNPGASQVNASSLF